MLRNTSALLPLMPCKHDCQCAKSWLNLLSMQIRWPYLSNARLTDLETETPAVRPLLGAAALARLRCQSAAAAYETSAAEGACFPASPRQWEHSPQPAASVPSPQSDRSVSDEGVARKCDGRGGWEDAVGCWAGTSTWVPPLQPAPRPSYCSSLEWHLPGGCEHVDLPCHHIWSLLQPLLTVQVSGDCPHLHYPEGALTVALEVLMMFLVLSLPKLLTCVPACRSAVFSSW